MAIPATHPEIPNPSSAPFGKNSPLPHSRCILVALSLGKVMASWNVNFLKPITPSSRSEIYVLATSNNKPHDLNGKNEERVTEIGAEFALIILNQPFSLSLLSRVWNSSGWRCCADGGANRLYDLLKSLHIDPQNYLPDLIKGDLDSLRDDVKKYYQSRNIEIIHDTDQDSTDLMKCVQALELKERAEKCLSHSNDLEGQYEIIVLGGLSGRLDQTIHTLSYLHKLRKRRKRVYAVTDDNIGWVLDSGEHYIQIDHKLLGPTCGLLPVGVDETMLSTRGLEWNLMDCHSGFDAMVSTSNHLVPGEDVVWVKTTKPIWWTVELRPL